jgi:hypothetical protein
MKIMAKQVTNRAGTIKLPGSLYMQTGRETLKDLFRVQFPDSKLIDDSGSGQGQQNLGVCGSMMNKGDSYSSNPQSGGFEHACMTLNV